MVCRVCKSETKYLGNGYTTWKGDRLVIFIRYCPKCKKYFTGAQEMQQEKAKPKNPNAGVRYSNRTDFKATDEEIRIAEQVKEKMARGELEVTKK